MNFQSPIPMDAITYSQAFQFNFLIDAAMVCGVAALVLVTLIFWR